MSWVRGTDGEMLCTEHATSFRAPFSCPTCVPSLAQVVDDEGGDADIRTAVAEGLPRLRDHEAWCVALSTEAKQLARVHDTGEHGPSACGPAYLRVALSARIEAARMADVRERRAWILDVERARAKSGSRAASTPPARPVANVGDPQRAGRGVH